MSRLTDDQQAAMDRFEKWLRRLFGRTPEGDARYFTTGAHTDAHGNLVINRGRILLVTPEHADDNWKVICLDERGSRSFALSLEGALIEALTLTLKQDFIEHH
jgi:hypothetical protein